MTGMFWELSDNDSQKRKVDCNFTNDCLLIPPSPGPYISELGVQTGIPGHVTALPSGVHSSPVGRPREKHWLTMQRAAVASCHQTRHE